MKSKAKYLFSDLRHKRRKLPMKATDPEQRIKQLDDEIEKLNDSLHDQSTSRVIVFEKLFKLEQEKRLLMTPEFKELPKYGDLMNICDFVEACKDGMFIDSDGHGYYVKNNLESNIMIVPSDVESNAIRPDFDQLIWFNR